MRTPRDTSCAASFDRDWNASFDPTGMPPRQKTLDGESWNAPSNLNSIDDLPEKYNGLWVTLAIERGLSWSWKKIERQMLGHGRGIDFT
mmetsp:Transcript_55271/g.117514  ORF Transcript_55271/g.117514 Transcript_55271/m.117514 type:complete len:89 (+) Transcript_55271:343-609(+)